METSESLKIIELLTGLEEKITENVVDKVTPIVTQATDTMRNSNAVIQETIKNSIQTFEHKTVPRFHLWVIYPLLAILYVAFTYMMTVDHRQNNIETGLEKEVRTLIKELNQKGSYTNGDAIKRLDSLHSDEKVKNN